MRYPLFAVLLAVCPVAHAQIEPVYGISQCGTTISQPGSYYLTKNLVCTQTPGILITSSSVTLDLRGFELRGSGGAQNGVRIDNVVHGVTVRNGSIRGWTQVGLQGPGCDACRFTDLSFEGNGSGLGVGDAAVLTNVVASYNTGIGILTNIAATLENCTSEWNGGAGIWTMAGSTIRGCSARFNAGAGFQAAAASTLTNNTSYGNGTGFQIGADCFLTENTAGGNVGDGIQTYSGGNRIDGNHAAHNGGVGIKIGTGGTPNVLVRNSSLANVGGNYQVPAGNVSGPLVNAASVGASSNPHANYQD